MALFACLSSQGRQTIARDGSDPSPPNISAARLNVNYCLFTGNAAAVSGAWERLDHSKQ